MNCTHALKGLIACWLVLAMAGSAVASGYGVFTQGAKGLGQANAVVAHPVGPSSLYFNPALLPDVAGRQLEVGTTAVSSDREFTSAATGVTHAADDGWSFPSTFYYTEQHERIAAGIGVFFPFGLSTEWDPNYEGRYIGTRGDITTLNINPVIACKVTDRLTLAFGLDLLYLDAELDSAINQVAAGFAVPPVLGGPVIDPTMPDVRQSFSGDGWGGGYNLGVAFKANDRISLGATYRSHIDVSVDGSATFGNVDPRLAMFFPATTGSADIRLPQQATAGVAVQFTSALVIEAGVRWEDWDSTRELAIDLDRPVLGQSVQVIPRDWQSTWTYNIGGEFALNDTWSLLAGYLYGEGAVPASTFEPLIPDSDAQLFTLGAETVMGAWTISGAFGYETHEDATKNNAIGDPLTGAPTLSANGSYSSDIYLVGLSIGYAF